MRRKFSGVGGGGRVLAGHQGAVRDHEALPVRALAVVRAGGDQRVLDEERDDVRQLGGLLLAVGEPGDLTAAHERGAVGGGDRVQDPGRVADEAERAPGRVAVEDDPRGVGVGHQVPQRAVTARVEDGVEPVHVHLGQGRGVGQGGLGLLVLVEPAGGVSLHLRLRARRVDGRLAAAGRGEGDLVAGVREDIVGRGELLEPEPGLAAGVAQLVVRGEDHQDAGHVWGPFVGGDCTLMVVHNRISGKGDGARVVSAPSPARPGPASDGRCGRCPACGGRG